MLKVLIIGGFLGAGKTTLLLRIARQLVDDGQRVAIIENEAGKVGVDDGLVRDAGLEVREIFGGCVCCSLGANLLVTLHQVQGQLDPDWVVVEPSGVASPQTLKQVLDGYDKPIERIVTVVLFDVERWGALSRVATPLVEGSLEAADVVALNKVDLWPSERVVELADELGQRRPDVPIVALAAKKGRGVDQLMAHVLDGQVQPHAAHEHDHHHHHHHHHGDPVAVARQYELEGDAAALVRDVNERLTAIARAIDANDDAVVGHVKASLRFNTGDIVTLRTTSSTRAPDATGQAPADDAKARLILNALAYNLPETTLADAVDRAMAGLVAAG